MLRVLICLLILATGNISIANERSLNLNATNFLYWPCRIEHYAFEIECGQLTISKANSLSEPPTLHYFKVAAKVRYPKPEPVIWIPDGLGIVATERAPFIISNLARLRNHRDLVWMDIRGTGKSNPIDCVDNTPPSMAARVYRYSDTEFVSKCHERLKSAGGIEAFSNFKIARDYEALRRHLGLTQVTVYAEGKGANIALAWAKLAPNSIKFQVLDSPPISAFSQNNQMHALRFAETVQQLISECHNTPACLQAFPDLNQQMNSVIKQLPVKVQVNDPSTLKTTSLIITQEIYVYLINQLLASPNRAKHLPLLISQAAKGNWQPMIGLVGLHWSKRTSQFNYGLHIANTCLAWQPELHTKSPVLPFLAQWFLTVEHARLTALCSEWIGNGLSADNPSKEMAKNSVRTLVLTAKNDPTTAHVYPQFSQLIHLIAQGAGHGLIHYGCTKDVIYRYFKAQDGSKNITAQALDAACLTQIPLPTMHAIHADKVFNP
jgi:pimeloyl-ACP methyl ester carboxylesterase